MSFENLGRFCNTGISFSQVTELPKTFFIRVVQLCVCLVSVPHFCFIEQSLKEIQGFLIPLAQLLQFLR